MSDHDAPAAALGEPGTLFIVATPIGNLDDITIRALRVLRGVDRILCEDTRVTRVLCERHGIRAPLLRHDAHTEARSAAGAIALLEAGERLALVSDAGTPGVSDPGQRLVRDVVAAGFTVVPVPGPSALTAAISASGLGATGFSFGGFLPKTRGPLDALLGGLPPGTHAFYVPARDLPTTCARVAEHPAISALVVARELTKAHETFYRGTPAAVAAQLAADPNAVRGEAVLLLEVIAREVDDDAIRDALEAARARGASLKTAAAEVAAELGVKKRRVYQLGLDAD
ncbi:MAG: 16S rRNA (cytidine(1402)-2'-O)-methyltransferase [Deltaproteobacteria bacterium]|nr:MAG: 16S rRNA (cytidine(1402)-2'-O)-methyltransferase [Deltaproteobacteria bacterium]